jgi:hypothetical protein
MAWWTRVLFRLVTVTGKFRPEELGSHQGFGDLWGEAGEQLELSPELGHDLVDGFGGQRQAECSQLHGEPVVGGAQGHGSGVVFAGFVAAEVGVAAAAYRQVRFGGAAEGVGHGSALAAVAAQEHAGCLAGGARVRNGQLVLLAEQDRAGWDRGLIACPTREADIGSWLYA